ncbi:MAG: hypothetical protein LBM93_10970 [Oscillospiraceae bacterium]|jgi:hypothetical protein|nr:hypothetical protein [Oscillospiraceae bacterium]
MKDISLFDIEMNKKLRNILVSNNIKTLLTLKSYSKEGLLTLHGIGENYINEIELLLNNYGLKLNSQGKNLTQRKIKNKAFIETPITVNKTSKVAHYTIMYKEKEVLSLDISTGSVVIKSKKYLPFRFRGSEKIRADEVILWISDRVNNISRQYMNTVYIARKVGRDRDAVLRDSCGLSFTDNFWIKVNDVKTTWSELKEKRDISVNLSKIALTGKIKNVTDILEGFSSLFATKGYFPKAVVGGYLVKLKTDAIFDYVAFLVAKQIGVNCAESFVDGNVVKIKIFTDENISLVHASELKLYLKSDLLYNGLLSYKGKNRDKLIRNMQRAFIFNYIIGNPDFHEDNYGVLYNSETFELIDIAPCFDHNVAFAENFDGITRMGNHGDFLNLEELAERFSANHKDIAEKLKCVDLSEIGKYLNAERKKELQNRISNVIKWANN